MLMDEIISEAMSLTVDEAFINELRSRASEVRKIYGEENFKIWLKGIHDGLKVAFTLGSTDNSESRAKGIADRLLG